MPFNVGDRVVCVRTFNNRGDHGVVGTTYEVLRVDHNVGTWYTLRGLDRQVSETRFELVTRAPVPAPPPEPEVEEPTVERVSGVRYVVVWCWHNEDPTDPDYWNYEIWIEEENARRDADERAEDSDYILIGTKKITLTFNVEI